MTSWLNLEGQFFYPSVSSVLKRQFELCRVGKYDSPLTDILLPLVAQFLTFFLTLVRDEDIRACVNILKGIHNEVIAEVVILVVHHITYNGGDISLEAVALSAEQVPIPRLVP
jgi:hypothetical protein